MNGKLLLKKVAKKFVTTIFILSATSLSVNAQGNFKVMNFTSIGDMKTATATSDGGMILGCWGLTTLPTVPAAFVKVDGNGDVLWSKRIYEQSNSFYPGAHSKIIGTNDGGIFILSNVLTKTNASGNVQWALSLSFDDLIQTQDQNYLGLSNSSIDWADTNNVISLTKISASGTVIWEKKISANNFTAEKLIEIDNDNIITIGAVTYQGSILNKIFLTSVNLNTNLINWSKAYELEYNRFHLGTVLKNANSELIFSGYKHDYNNNEDGNYIVKMDFQGNILWSKTIEGSMNKEFITGSIIANDGGYVFAGNTESFGAGYKDVYCFKLAQNGDLLWTRTLGGAGTDGAHFLRNTGNEFSLFGATQSIQCIPNIFIAKLDETNSNCWDSGSGGFISDVTLTDSTLLLSIFDDTITQPQSIAIIEDTVSGLVFSEECPVLCFAANVENIGAKGSINLFPNPASNYLKVEGFESENVTYIINNYLGSEIGNGALSIQNQNIDIENLESGLYTITLKAKGDIISIQKFVKE
ncbi:MAG: T9SS type A sorting domain-containing protein [Bacteroidetes bacterium]|nr:T9SS type A sorting domain-containing protein [Bacteroidota bacterium]